MGFQLNTEAKTFQPRKPTAQEEAQMKVQFLAGTAGGDPCAEQSDNLNLLPNQVSEQWPL